MAQEKDKQPSRFHRTLHRIGTFKGIAGAHPSIRHLYTKEQIGGLGVLAGAIGGAALGFTGGGIAARRLVKNGVIHVPSGGQIRDVLRRGGARVRAFFKPRSKATDIAVRTLSPTKITQDGKVLYNREPHTINVPRGAPELGGLVGGYVGGAIGAGTIAARRSARRAEKVRHELNLPGPKITGWAAARVAPSQRLAWREHVKQHG